MAPPIPLILVEFLEIKWIDYFVRLILLDLRGMSLIELLLGECLDGLIWFESVLKERIVFGVVLFGFLGKDFHFGLFFESVSDTEHFLRSPERRNYCIEINID